ncbi:hypothetical protein SHL15_6151 [Streptomyces hygroscopicus subsp. limoneus]|nr:hypothetical protein SHL15_6151 [Streptomyces hygroscopicus subsp. limoneus]
MGLPFRTVLPTAADRGFGRTLAVEPSGPRTAVHAGVRNFDRPMSGHEPTGVRERGAVSGGGAP